MYISSYCVMSYTCVWCSVQQTEPIARRNREQGYEVKHHQSTQKADVAKESAHIPALWIDFIEQAVGHGATANYLYPSLTPREIRAGRQICCEKLS